MNSLQLSASLGVLCTLVFGIIAVIYYFKCHNLMTAISVTKWSEIADHYAQIRFLKEAGWKM